MESKRSGRTAGTTINIPARQESQPSQPVASQDSSQPLQTIYSGNVEIVEMDRMRKLIAEHMVRSKQTSPHVTSFTEADVTHLVQWRDRVKKEFESREGEKLTFTPLLLRLSFAASRNIPGSTAALTVQN